MQPLYGAAHSSERYNEGSLELNNCQTPDTAPISVTYSSITASNKGQHLVDGKEYHVIE